MTAIRPKDQSWFSTDNSRIDKEVPKSAPWKSYWQTRHFRLDPISGGEFKTDVCLPGFAFADPAAAWRGRGPIAVSGGDRGVFSWRAELDLHFVQSGMGIGRLEAEQIAVVKIVIELVHAELEVLARFEQLVLAAGHCRDCFRDVLSHSLSGHKDRRQQVRVIGLPGILAAGVVQHSGKCGGKRERVHDDIAAGHRGRDVGQRHGASVVARLADQKQHSEAVVGSFVEHRHGIVDRVQDGGAAVAGPQSSQVVPDGLLVAREIASESHFAVEFDDGHVGVPLFEHRTEHCAEPLHPLEFGRGCSATLKRNDDRDGLGIEDFVELDGLLDAVVFDREIAGAQSEDQLALYIFDEGGREHHCRLRPQHLVLILGRGVADQQKDAQQESEPLGQPHHLIPSYFAVRAIW